MEVHKIEKNQKAIELNPIFIQSLLKESKFKVKNSTYLYFNIIWKFLAFRADKADAGGQNARSRASRTFGNTNQWC